MKRQTHKGQAGFMTAGNIVAVGVVGVTMTMLLTAVSSGVLGFNTAQARSKATNLGISQMEYVRNLSWASPPTTYQTGVTLPPEFTMTSEGQTVPGADTNLQKIVVTISRGAQQLLVMENLKVNLP